MNPLAYWSFFTNTLEFANTVNVAVFNFMFNNIFLSSDMDKNRQT